MELQPNNATGDFTLSFKDWVGVSPPLAYRVSSTSGDNIKLADMSNGWLSFNETYNANFTFKPTNFNPIIVEITDYTEEIYTKYLSFEGGNQSE